MVREIVKDPFLLMRKSVRAMIDDLHIVDDLIDTLRDYQRKTINAPSKMKCVGMAANMIGETKKMLIAGEDPNYLIMINPTITKKSDEYRVCEGCISVNSVREVTRYKNIKVDYYDKDFNFQQGTFEGFIAQIIQHEMDHFEGKLV